MGQLLKRQEEFIRYALFGIAAVAADVLVYALTVGHLGIRLANALSWLAAVVAAFITNKYWLLHRGLLVQVWGTDALVRKGFQRPLLGIQGGAAKLLTTVIVIALNYFFSKFLVFRPREVQS